METDTGNSFTTEQTTFKITDDGLNIYSRDCHISHPCPACGYCPRCGRGGRDFYHPYYPSYPFWYGPVIC